MLHEKNIPHCASVQCDLRGITPRHKEDLMRFLAFFFFSFFLFSFFFFCYWYFWIFTASLIFNPHLLNQHCLKSQLGLVSMVCELGVRLTDGLVSPLSSQRERVSFMNPRLSPFLDFISSKTLRQLASPPIDSPSDSTAGTSYLQV